MNKTIASVQDKKRKALRLKKLDSSATPKKSLSLGGDVGGSHNVRQFGS